MNKKIEYIVRYDDNQRFVTMYCIDKYNMEDLVTTLEKNNYSYMVIKLNNMEDYKVKWLCNIDDIFKEEENND